MGCGQTAAETTHSCGMRTSGWTAAVGVTETVPQHLLCHGFLSSSLRPLIAHTNTGGDAARVGLVTYDSSVHFYAVSPGQASARMLVMPDVGDAYAPMPGTLLAPLAGVREQLSELLAAMPSMFAAASGPESCGAAAIEVLGLIYLRLSVWRTLPPSHEVLHALHVQGWTPWLPLSSFP